MMDIRKEIASRLKFEFERRGVKPEKISTLTGVSATIVSAYLNAKKEIRFSEITPVCEKLGINPVRLLYSYHYPRPNLAFRNIGENIQQFAAQIEDIFLILGNFLPDLKIPQEKRFSNDQYQKKDLITEAAGFATKFQKQFNTPADFIEHYNVPVFPVYQRKLDFDAFLISYENRSAICINSAKPPARIHFSLAHEIAHLLFDRNQAVPIDSFLPNLYWKNYLKKDEIPEFFAYKFAEFYLLPMEIVEYHARNWPDINIERVQNLINVQQASKHVFENALYDVLQIYPPSPIKSSLTDDYQTTGDQFKRMDWEESLSSIETGQPFQITFKSVQSVCQKLQSSQGADIHQFLGKCTQKLSRVIRKNEDFLSDIVIETIAEVLQLELR